MADRRGGAEGNFMQVLLAEQDSACCFQSVHDFGVRGGNAILEDRAGQGRPHSCCIGMLFESERDAVERPAPPAAPHFSFSRPRLRQSLLGGHGDEGIKARVQPLDPL